MYKRDDYMEMPSGNKVSRLSHHYGSQRILLIGKSVLRENVLVRGDLANVKIGRYCHVGEKSVLRPAFKIMKGSGLCIPLTIGDYTTIGPNCVISAASIGSYVDIGENVVIANRCIVKDCSRILPNSVLGPDTVVPPFTVFGGTPARQVGELDDTQQELSKSQAVSIYNAFQPMTQ
eukprot:comp13086_c0_seq1/m.17726 comp13086_c0_seq1/g.17726  ORF comp13086_c0_seq1/g.17726 comp13086_c0_seq1/m.17726 type:complete len:176 (+) comp13086_c0_seq1:23-550(+)